MRTSDKTISSHMYQPYYVFCYIGHLMLVDEKETQPKLDTVILKMHNDRGPFEHRCLSFVKV